MFDVFILATGLAWLGSCLWVLLAAAFESKAPTAERALLSDNVVTTASSGETDGMQRCRAPVGQ
jgi:hypothetical protein